MKNSKCLYFIAIVPPEPLFSEIKSLKQYMSDRYFSNAAMRSPAHITLHMPFQWKEEKEKRLIQSVTDFSEKQLSFEVSLNGFGCFEPRVIYIKVEENISLKKLQMDLMNHAKKDLYLFNANYREKPFHPHVTIAFRNFKKTIFPVAWEEFKDKKYSSAFMTSSLFLLKHNSSSWEICKEFKFKM